MNGISQLIHTYGYLAVFIGAGIDHSGVSWPLVAAAVIAWSGKLDIIPLLLAASGGIIVFDHIMYAIGRLFSVPIAAKATRSPGWSKVIASGEHLFERHGAAVVVWGRFIATVGRLTPLFAGMFHMQYRLFLLYTLGGAVITACLFGYIPYLIGGPVLQIARYADAVTKLLLALLVAGILILIIYILSRNRRPN